MITIHELKTKLLEGDNNFRLKLEVRTEGGENFLF